MKKLWVFFLLPAFLFSSDLEERVSLLEKEMGQVSTETANQTFGANFSPGNFQKGWIGLFLTGEVLYWHPKVGGTEYLYRFLQDGTTLIQQGDAEDHTFNWGWGARAGIGLTFPGLGWELICTGTWYSTDQTNTKEARPPTILISQKGAFFTLSDQARSSYDLSYDEVLLELKKPYFLSRFLSTYTSIGAKRSWVDQEQRLKYQIQPSQLYQVKDICCFEGTGPRIGLGTQWHLFYGLNFIAEIGASLLYGKYDVKHKEVLPPISEINLKGNTHLFSPQVDFSLGLGWDLYTSGYHFGVSLSYEALYLWRQNEALMLEDAEMLHLKVARYADDITFYGVTLKVKIEF